MGTDGCEQIGRNAIIYIYGLHVHVKAFIHLSKAHAFSCKQKHTWVCYFIMLYMIIFLSCCLRFLFVCSWASGMLLLISQCSVFPKAFFTQIKMQKVFRWAVPALTISFSAMQKDRGTSQRWVYEVARMTSAEKEKIRMRKKESKNGISTNRRWTDDRFI